MASHLKVVGRSYFDHFWFAFKAAGLLLYAAFASLIHAFIPELFKFKAEQIVTRLYIQSHNRRAERSRR